MAKRTANSRIDPALEIYINKMLKAVTLDVKDDNGKQKYSLTDVCRVADRKLKLEAIKAKLDDTDMGSGFGDDEGGD